MAVAQTRSNTGIPKWHDPAFGHYLDLVLLSKAWQEMDPDLMIDAALQLAEGERVLQRSHKALSSGQLLNLALKIAGEKKDKPALERLTKVAERTGNRDLAGPVAPGIKLAGQSRAADAALQVSVVDMTPTDFATFHAYVRGIQASRIRGDRKVLEHLEKTLRAWTGGSEKQREYLKRAIAESRANLPPPDTSAAALDKLQAASRQQWGGWTPPPVSVPIPNPSLPVPLIPDFGPGGGGGPNIQIPLLPGAPSDSSSSGDDSVSEPQDVVGSFLITPGSFRVGGRVGRPANNKKITSTRTKDIPRLILPPPVMPLSPHPQTHRHHAASNRRIGNRYSRGLPLEVQDPAFESHADLLALGEAWHELNPAALADVGLQFAAGESILLRPHKALSARAILSMAVQLASERQDKATLDRLAKAAERLGDQELTIRIATAQKLAGTARALDPAFTLSVEEVQPGDFALYRAYMRDIEAARLGGDRKELERIDKELPNLEELPPDRVEYLKKLTASARAALPKEGAERDAPQKETVAATLNKLASAIRDDVSFSEWDCRYTTSRGTVNNHVVLQGDSGSYTLEDGSTGSLSNIRYSGGNVVIVRGIWSFQGQYGQFEWRVVPDGSQFLGNWRYLDTRGRPQGAWNGVRTDGSNN
jgi:hypothetical protein